MLRLILLIFIGGCTAAAVDTPVVVDTPAAHEERATPAFRMRSDQCLPIAEMTASLRQHYREQLSATATMLVPDARIIVLFYASEEASWSMVVVGGNGIACLVMWGENWKRNRSSPI